jgi:hypothetical protein
MLARLRPSPAMIVALIALFVALGGSTYAAIKLPKGSVGSKQLRKNAVTSKKIKNGQVKGADIASGAVTGAKIKDGSLGGGDVAESALGKVPAAGNADTLGGLPAGAFAREGVFRQIPLRTLGRGTSDGETPIFSAGPFTVTVACFSADGKAQLRARVQSSVGRSSALGLVDVGQGTEGIDLGPDDPASKRIFLFRNSGGESSFWFSQGAVTVFAPDGRGAQISLYADYNFPVQPGGGTSGGCRFAGSAVVY